MLRAMKRLDDRDIAILSVLSREGRISKTDLARRVNLSPTPCWERLRRLEEAGFIAGYRAEVALAKLTHVVTVFVTVELEAHKAENFQAFERVAMARPEITGCWAVGGGFDYLLQVVARDVEAYQDLIETLLSARAGVKRYFSYFLTKEVVNRPPPFADLLAEDSSG